VAARLEPIRWAPSALVLAAAMPIGVLAGLDPRLAVFAVLGLAFATAMFVDLAIGVVLLLIVVFAETTPLAGPVLSFTKVAGLLLALAWFARVAIQPDGKERLIFAAHPVLTYVLILFLAWTTVSTVWAQESGAALTQASRFALVAVLYVIVYTAVRGRRQAFWVIGGFVAGAAGTAAYGLVLRPEADVGTGRLVSTVQDPNFLAATLVAGFVLALAGFLAARGQPALRLATASAATLCLMAFLLTGSRGGVIAFGVALLAAVLVADRGRGKVLLAVAGILFVAVGYFTVYAPDDVRERILGATQGEAQQDEGRFTIWTVGWRMFEDNSVSGVGAGNFEHRSVEYIFQPGTVFQSDRVIDNPGYAHNTYLGPLAELGVIGFVLFAAFLAVSAGCALAAVKAFKRSGDWQMEILARGLVVALAGVLAADFFVSAEYNKFTWLLLGLGPALLGVARSEQHDREHGASINATERPAGSA